MGLTRPELGMLATACALVGWAAWLLINVDDRVERDLLQMRMRTSSRWFSWVDAGIPADSATQLGLSDLRARLAGDTPRELFLESIAEPNLEWARQAVLLNPFHEASLTSRLTQQESQSLFDARMDIRNALAAGRPAVRERSASRAQHILAAAIALFAVLAGGVAYRAQRRTSMPAAALQK